MDRAIPPQVEELNGFEFLKAKSKSTINGINIHFIEGGDQEVIKVELLFKAGYRYQNSALQAAAVNQLLTEGTVKYDAAEIAEKFESKGAFIEQSLQADYAGLSMHCLNRHLKELFPLLIELTQDSIFPEEEVQNFKQLKKQKFIVNQEKVSFLAKNHFASTIFGAEHPYNNGIYEADFELLERDRLREFYQTHYLHKSFDILLSGNVNSNALDLIESKIEDLKFDALKEVERDFKVNPSEEKRVLIERPTASQSAIRLGAASISKRHTDFPALYFANTLLGGFFGSRLMSNLREEKGYTYGVGSGIMSFQKGAYFFISTEVGVKHTQAALDEIEFEINRLKREEVSEVEIQTVKNYLLGSIMRNFDGPFAAMDRFKSLLTNDIDYDYYQNLIKSFQQINSEQLKAISEQYFNFDELRELIAGKI